MAWHPHLHNRRLHPNSVCRTTSLSLPVPHTVLINELCNRLRCNRSELFRRLLEAVAADDLPIQALEASRSQNRRRALMRPYDRDASTKHDDPPPSNQQ